MTGVMHIFEAAGTWIPIGDLAFGEPVTATPAWGSSASAGTDVADNDVHHFSFDPIAGPQFGERRQVVHLVLN